MEPGRLGRHVAGDAARERELAEQLAHPLRVPGDARVDLAVGPLEVGVGDDRRAAVARPDDVDRVEVPVPDHPVHVGVDEVEPGRRAPVAEQARLDVLRRGAARAGAGCRAGRSGRPRGSSRPASRRRSGRARQGRAVLRPCPHRVRSPGSHSFSSGRSGPRRGPRPARPESRLLVHLQARSDGSLSPLARNDRLNGRPPRCRWAPVVGDVWPVPMPQAVVHSRATEPRPGPERRDLDSVASSPVRRPRVTVRMIRPDDGLYAALVRRGMSRRAFLRFSRCHGGGPRAPGDVCARGSPPRSRRRRACRSSGCAARPAAATRRRSSRPPGRRSPSSSSASSPSSTTSRS